MQADAYIFVDWFGERQKKYIGLHQAPPWRPWQGDQTVHHHRGFMLEAEPDKGHNLFNKFGLAKSGADKGFADYTRVSLVGNSISVTVNLGNPGASCGCNVAFFLLSMPSAEPNQWGGEYCDANGVGGNFCAEFDLMEMNSHVLRTTSHPCSDYRAPPFVSKAEACNKNGESYLSFGHGMSAPDFGPGEQFKINSQEPFQFKMDFPVENGKLVGHVTLSQQGRVLTGSLSDLEHMRAPLTDGMVLAMSSWYSHDMLWLDGVAGCKKPEFCNVQTAYFEDIAVAKLT